jgi:hypothetical protein
VRDVLDTASFQVIPTKKVKAIEECLLVAEKGLLNDTRYLFNPSQPRLGFKLATLKV